MYKLRNLGFIAGFIRYKALIFIVFFADYVGHIKLVNGQVLSDGPLLDEAEIAASRRVDLHVQTHE